MTKFLFLLIPAASIFAAPHAVNLKFESLTLRSGKRLDQVSVKSYDAENGRVLMLADRRLVYQQLDQLPYDAAQQIVNFSPAENAEPSKRLRIQRNSSAGASPVAVKTPPNNSVTKTQLSSEKQQQAQLHAAQSQTLLLAQIKRFAEQRVDRYYRLEYHPAAGSLVIVNQSLRLDEPVEVAGASGHYRVAGNIGLQFFDDQGRHSGRATQPFELVVAVDGKGSLSLLEFASK
ncbi:hypothetical protein [Oleiharenicola lentus]|uniref:hypothetical protein n=1 Tax=Oleiharenicola lentus TaxID=2508720 RepID=UPI003F669865